MLRRKKNFVLGTEPNHVNKRQWVTVIFRENNPRPAMAHISRLTGSGKDSTTWYYEPPTREIPGANWSQSGRRSRYRRWGGRWHCSSLDATSMPEKGAVGTGPDIRPLVACARFASARVLSATASLWSRAPYRRGLHNLAPRFNPPGTIHRERERQRESGENNRESNNRQTNRVAQISIVPRLYWIPHRFSSLVPLTFPLPPPFIQCTYFISYTVRAVLFQTRVIAYFAIATAVLVFESPLFLLCVWSRVLCNVTNAPTILIDCWSR